MAAILSDVAASGVMIYMYIIWQSPHTSDPVMVGQLRERGPWGCCRQEFYGLLWHRISSEAQLKLKFREILLTQNLLMNCQIVLKFHAEHGNDHDDTIEP